MLNEDYNKYCYYRGIPRDSHFEKYVIALLGELETIYIDGECFEKLIPNYKFKSMDEE